MKINIGNHAFTELWDGVLYKALSDYPIVSDNEMKDMIDFANYEKNHGRQCEIEADRKDILQYVQNKNGFVTVEENQYIIMERIIM